LRRLLCAGTTTATLATFSSVSTLAGLAGLATTTSEASSAALATEFGLEVATSADFLVVTVATLEFAARGSVTLGARGSVGTVAILAALASSRASGGLRLLKSRRNDLLGQVQITTQVLDTLVCKVKVVPLPVEGLLNQVSRLERLQKLDHIKVGDINIVMLAVENLLSGNNAIFEQLLVNQLPSLLALILNLT